MFLIVSGVAHAVVHDEKVISVGDEIQLRKTVPLLGKKYPQGSRGVVDKHDPSREFPFTIRILNHATDGPVPATPEGGPIRGRVMANGKNHKFIIEKKMKRKQY